MRSPAVRNVVLVGPSGAGKTTLAEALLVEAGAIQQRGSVDGHSTASDHSPVEHRLGRSVTLTPLSFTWQSISITLLDTPGYADFVGEVRAGLRGADAALFVIGAGDGIDPATQLLWQECEAVGMPRAVVVTKLDREHTDFDESLALARRAFGDGVQPMYLPMLADDESVAGVIGLLTQHVYDYSTGSRETRESEPAHHEMIEESRNGLIEGVITESEDETLMDRFLSGESLAIDMLIDDLERAVARGHFHPVLPVALGTRTVGVREVLELIDGGFPTPAERQLPVATTPDGHAAVALSCDPAGPLCAEVIQTTSDQFAGRLSLVRVLSGTLRPDSVLHVSGHFLADRGHPDHDDDDRIGVISRALGADLSPVDAAEAGNIVTVARLHHAETGDTLSSPAEPMLVEPWVMPDPLLPVAVAASGRHDEDKLSTALGRLQAEDPTVRVERNAETHQVVLWCMGQTHADVLLDRLRTRFGVNVSAETQRIALRTTLAGPAAGHGRLVKQSGGHGQYAVVEIEVQPTEPGSGYRFIDRIVGGTVPRQYIASVDRGVQQQMAAGLEHGFPVVDLQVTLVDGKAHSVDSSDMAFATAGGLALKDAAAKVGEVLLERVAEVAIEVSDEYVGAVMSDLASRRGRMTGSQSHDGGFTQVTAIVPAAELTRYAIDLRALTHGSATFSRTDAGYEPVPERLRERMLTDS